MSNANKSIALLLGVGVFFGLMILGPVLSDRLDRVVAWGAAQSTEITPTTVDKGRLYASSGLGKAHDCCIGQCETQWDYQRDLCDPTSQKANACLIACVEAPTPAPKADAHH